MTTIELSHSEYVKSAKLDYIGYESGGTAGTEKFRLTVDVLVGNSANVTISIDDFRNCKTSSGYINTISSSSIETRFTLLKTDWSVSNTSSNVSLSSKVMFNDVGTKKYSSNGTEQYVTIGFSGRYSGLIYITVNVIDTTISLNTGSEWVSGVPYVNTGSEWVKAKEVYIHDGTGWKLSK